MVLLDGLPGARELPLRLPHVLRVRIPLPLDEVFEATSIASRSPVEYGFHHIFVVVF